MRYIHPIDDEHVIEGNGSISIEILDEIGNKHSNKDIIDKNI